MPQTLPEKTNVSIKSVLNHKKPAFWMILVSLILCLSLALCFLTVPKGNNEDGVIRIQGIDQKDEIHLFDISIVDGNVHLTEKGIPIGEVAETKTLAYSLLYCDPTLSWVLNSDEIPFVEIKDGKLYETASISNDMLLHTELGTVTEITTKQKDFKILEDAYGGSFAELVNEILDNNHKIYHVDPHDKYGVSLYYVMYQKDGSTILVYGHYENSQKTDFIRWIFKIDN